MSGDAERKHAIGVVFAGGGTGGHIHPNLAVAEHLYRLTEGDCASVFVVSDRAIDARVLESAQIAGAPAAYRVSRARPLAMSPLGLIACARRWAGGVRVGREAIRTLRASCERVVMIATGGFVSAPAIMGARAEQAERFVINLDVVPGKANRLASRFATKTLSVGRDLRPIVSSRWADLPAAEEARAAFGLDAERRTLLVTGGSQGARSVNRFVIECAQRGVDLASWQVLHQTGSGEDEACAAAWTGLGIRASVSAYIDRMDIAFAAADAVVCRGGAGTVADLWASGRPALILPYPHHKDNHQSLNARPLIDAGGAILADDLIDARRNANVHGPSLARLLDDGARTEMSAGLARLGPADGAETLARRILSIASMTLGSD
ncbi:MAG: UDP-N-acetylglucosamine--N-acetylmuramyl-(pentapeptide) pyrophosphoryl-undecaprenol N-acetylglucosamine transferase [Planctomycetota bacterium]